MPRLDYVFLFYVMVLQWCRSVSKVLQHQQFQKNWTMKLQTRKSDLTARFQFTAWHLRGIDPSTLVAKGKQTLSSRTDVSIKAVKTRRHPRGTNSSPGGRIHVYSYTTRRDNYPRESRPWVTWPVKQVNISIIICSFNLSWSNEQWGESSISHAKGIFQLRGHIAVVILTERRTP